MIRGFIDFDVLERPSNLAACWGSPCLQGPPHWNMIPVPGRFSRSGLLLVPCSAGRIRVPARRPRRRYPAGREVAGQMRERQPIANAEFASFAVRPLTTNPQVNWRNPRLVEIISRIMSTLRRVSRDGGSTSLRTEITAGKRGRCCLENSDRPTNGAFCDVNVYPTSAGSDTNKPTL